MCIMQVTGAGHHGLLEFLNVWYVSVMLVSPITSEHGETVTHHIIHSVRDRCLTWRSSLVSVSAVHHHHVPVPVRCHVRRLRPRHHHGPNGRLDGLEGEATRIQEN